MEEKSVDTVVLNGRVKNRRVHKNCAFIDLDTPDKQIQLLLGIDQKIPQLGDIVSVSGDWGQTRAGMKTLFVKELTHLAACTDPSKLDVKLRELIILRNKLETLLRQSFQNAGAIEVSSNIFTNVRGTSKIEPFRTSDLHNTVYYLRFTHEMALKKILVDTQLPVFEMGKVFRNMGSSRTHFPEYTVLEAQFPYKKYTEIMDFIGKTMQEVAVAFGCQRFSEIPRYTMQEIFRKLGYSFDSLSLEEQKTIYKTKVKRAEGPFFLTNPPKVWSPLAAENNDGTAKDAEFVYKGMGLSHICEEKTDPKEIERALVQTAQRPEDIDREFIEKMYLGLPPTTGVAIGVDRTYMAMRNLKTMAETVIR